MSEVERRGAAVDAGNSRIGSSTAFGRLRRRDFGGHLEHRSAKP
jgi:hypothetical protein